MLWIIVLLMLLMFGIPKRRLKIDFRTPPAPPAPPPEAPGAGDGDASRK